MDRLACVDVPALPLQLLLRRHARDGWAEWNRFPVAVVDRDKPQGLLLWVNERARRAGILPGQRYAAAQVLSPELRAAEVAPAEIEACVSELCERLRRHTPDVEPAAGEPGVFWLGAAGLEGLYPSLVTGEHGWAQVWAEALRGEARGLGLRAVVVVGFHRFGTYAVARARPRANGENAVVVFACLDEEQAAMRRVPLDRIGLPPPVQGALAQLAVRTVGQFLALPATGIRRRFGEEAHRLHRLGTGDLWSPLSPRPAPDPVERFLDLDDPEEDNERLAFLVKRELDPLLVKLAARGEALAELALSLRLEKRAPVLDVNVRPAEPTLDIVQVLGLLRLRLESLRLEAGVTRIAVRAIGVRATTEQLRLFAARPRRDPAAGARAIARVRAALGDGAVVRAKLREGHLPEARYGWEPVDRLPSPAPRAIAVRTLVRRIAVVSELLPPREAREPDGWFLDGGAQGSQGLVEQLEGPHLVSGAWWRVQIDRDYYFAKLRSGALHWVYYDRRRRRWYRQGQVG